MCNFLTYTETVFNILTNVHYRRQLVAPKQLSGITAVRSQMQPITCQLWRNMLLPLGLNISIPPLRHKGREAVSFPYCYRLGWCVGNTVVSHTGDIHKVWGFLGSKACVSNNRIVRDPNILILSCNSCNYFQISIIKFICRIFMYTVS
jgi:hypothetical protein